MRRRGGAQIERRSSVVAAPLGVVVGAIVALLGHPVFVAQTPRAADATPRWDKDIRPLLADRCFRCHGSDRLARRANLRLDLEEDAYQKHGSRREAIIPGDPEHSELIARIRSDVADYAMPPRTSGVRGLSTDEVLAITRWIKDGARYEPHWSFAPPKTPALPKVEKTDWPRNDLDRFILAALESRGLSPSPEASKETLCRRVFLDLTGLPPTPDEVDRFLADPRPDAFERLVHALMNDPPYVRRYAERMASPWLDLARYADTCGLHLDAARQIWPWRDWVLDAFATNMPYDRFTVEQLAGDLLPNATLAQNVASGFNRNHPTTDEAGTIADEAVVEYAADRASVTASVFLGLTMNCARCHDHKFDPISQKEYYDFFAFFNSIDEPGLYSKSPDVLRAHEPFLFVPNADEAAALDVARTRVSTLEKSMADLSATDEATRSAFFENLKKSAGIAWDTVTIDSAASAGGATLTCEPDGTVHSSGKNPDQDVQTFTMRVNGGGFMMLLVEALPDPTIVGARIGRGIDGNAILTGVSAIARSRTQPTVESAVPLRIAFADHEQPAGNYRALNVLDTSDKEGWGADGNACAGSRALVLVAEYPFGYADGTDLVVTLQYDSVLAQQSFARVRFRVGRLALVDFTGDFLHTITGKDTRPHDLAGLLIPEDARSPELTRRIDHAWRMAHVPAYCAMNADLEVAKKTLRDLETKTPKTMVMRESAEPRPTFLLARGRYDRPVKDRPAVRGVPRALGVFDRALPKNRLGLARWITSPENPLAARVAVNRFFELVFGRAIVRTTDDFGYRGEWPSHPELLDHLALEFRSNGWDVKRLIEMFVTSSTYRQESRARADVLAVDPENRMLGFFPRTRLSAEQIRDQALYTSGLLVERFGGPPVRPPQPPGLWEEVGLVESNTRFYTRTAEDEIKRRSLYTYWKRGCPPPFLMTFDAPSRETCTIRRAATNTPLQALALWNDLELVESARALAARTIGDRPTDAERIALIFRRLNARSPDEIEMRTLTHALGYFRTRYTEHPDDAKALIATGESKAPTTFDAVELAAWTMVVSTVMNTDAVITRG